MNNSERSTADGSERDVRHRMSRYAGALVP